MLSDVSLRDALLKPMERLSRLRDSKKYERGIQSLPKTTSRWTRREAIGGSLSAAAFAAAMPAFARRPLRKPNFLFIMADDLGYADLSCFGRTEYQTPALDALAREGMRLTHSYSNSAVCSSTRVGLITGRYQYRLPVGLHEPITGVNQPGLPAEHPTLPSILKKLGYHTSLVGKWHLGQLPDFGPLKSGYDEFWGIRGGGVDYFTHKVMGQSDLWDGDTKIERQGYLTKLLTDRALETLDRRKKSPQPWLMSLHYTAPHWPWEGTDGSDESAYLDEKGNQTGMSIMHYDGGTMATYAKMVTDLDRQIGRVLQHLKKLGMAKDTVVVFTSDNGGERFSNTWPFTGKKTELLEGGIRVPTIVRWPGLTKSGSESTEQVMSMDWLPTFVSAAGGTPEPAYSSDGMDVRPALSGMTLPERTLFWRFNNKRQEAARRGRWKYLKMGDNTFLFDVVSDPLERGNLKERYPDVFQRLVNEFSAWNAGMLFDPAAPSYGFSPDQLADHFDPGT